MNDAPSIFHAAFCELPVRHDGIPCMRQNCPGGACHDRFEEPALPQAGCPLHDVITRGWILDNPGRVSDYLLANLDEVKAAQAPQPAASGCPRGDYCCEGHGMCLAEVERAESEPADSATRPCCAEHRRPGSLPMAVWVDAERDADGQPTHLSVAYANGAHVGEAEAEYVRQAIRAAQGFDRHVQRTERELAAHGLSPEPESLAEGSDHTPAVRPVRVYLSGPMTGYPDYNFPAFHKAAAHLRTYGYDVVNPAEEFTGQQDLPYSTYLRRDVEHLLTVDEVRVLPMWLESTGARLEVAVAVALGLPVRTVAGLDVLPDCPARNVLAGMLPRPGLVDRLEEAEARASETALQEAQRLVHGDRGADYGHPLDDFSKTALIWTAVLSEKLRPGVQVEAEDVPLCMVGVKISREVNRPKRDNRVDGAGYFETLDMVVTERARREAAAPDRA